MSNFTHGKTYYKLDVFSMDPKNNSQTPLPKIERKTHIPFPLPKEKKP
jgi:hypothetical protein